MKQFVIVAFVSVLLLPAGPSDAQSIRHLSLDSVTGLHNVDTIFSDQSIIFLIRVTNLTSPESSLTRLWNGFRIHSPTGASWQACSGRITDALPMQELPMRAVWEVGITGTGSDSVGFEAACGFVGGNPLSDSVDEVLFEIAIGPIDRSFEGHVICLDTVTVVPAYPGLAHWNWRLGGCEYLIAEVAPEWDGPHCFTVTQRPCAVIITGDANRDGLITAADILTIVNWIFKGGEPVGCMADADANCSGTVTAADVIYLVNYIFKGGPNSCNVCDLIWSGTWTCLF